MYTPTHALANLAGLGRRHEWPIFAGAVLPDVPAVVHQVYGRLSGHWPSFALATMLFHAAPPALLLLAVAAWRRWAPAAAFALSLLCHDALDFPFHHGDALRHFWPLSDFRFVSPLSYWDPAHHAAQVRPIELAIALLSSLFLWRRHRSPWFRAALVAACAFLAAVTAAGRPLWTF